MMVECGRGWTEAEGVAVKEGKCSLRMRLDGSLLGRGEVRGAVMPVGGDCYAP